MALTIFSNSSNIANIVIAKDTATFASMGFDNTNISKIFEVGATGLRSWVPGRSLNPISGTVQGRGYYIESLVDLDVSDFFEIDGDSAGTSIISKTTLTPTENMIYQLAPEIMAWKFMLLSATAQTVRIGLSEDAPDIMGDTNLVPNKPLFYSTDVEPGAEIYFSVEDAITIVIYKLEI